MNKPKIRLEPFTRNDYDTLISLVEDEKSMIQFAGSIFRFPITHTQLNKYISDPNRIVFKAVDEQSGLHIGHCEAYQGEKGNVRLCRILIGPKHCRGKGLGTAVIKALTQFSFERLRASSVTLNVYNWNTNAIRCYRKVGFEIIEGEESQTILAEETWTAIKMKISKDKFLRKHSLCS